MALSLFLSNAGHPPTRIETTATVHLNKVGEGFSITGIDLVTGARCPGCRQPISSGWPRAKTNCIVSRALSVPMTLSATGVDADDGEDAEDASSAPPRPRARSGFGTKRVRQLGTEAAGLVGLAERVVGQGEVGARGLEEAHPGIGLLDQDLVAGEALRGGSA